MAKVLVVDDNKLVRAILTDILTSYGHKVFQAEDGEDGVKVAFREVPDLIVADHYMPGMDGATMIRILKTTDLTKNIPVLVLVGTSEAERLCKEAGGDLSLRKPLNEGDLKSAVEGLLKQLLTEK